MPFHRLFKEKVPTLDQMHSLVRFVEQGSLSAAFGKGKSDQAGATQQLGRIDRCFGIKTRESAGSYKVPTAEAKELAELCRDFLQKLEDFKARSERAPNSFVVAAGDTLTFYLLIPALREIRALRGSTQLYLHNRRSREIVRGLMSGEFDVGLVRSDAVDELVRKGRLKAEKLCRVEYVFCLRRELLSGFTGNTKDDTALVKWCIENVPLATFWGESSTFTAALAKTGIKLPIQLCCESFPQALQAIVAGGYCGIVPQISLTNSQNSDLFSFGSKLLSATGRDVGLVWSSALTERRKGGEAALSAIRGSLKGVVKTLARPSG